MSDLMYLVLILLCFGISLLLIRLFERLGGAP